MAKVQFNMNVAFLQANNDFVASIYQSRDSGTYSLVRIFPLTQYTSLSIITNLKNSIIRVDLKR